MSMHFIKLHNSINSKWTNLAYTYMLIAKGGDKNEVGGSLFIMHAIIFCISVTGAWIILICIQGLVSFS